MTSRTLSLGILSAILCFAHFAVAMESVEVISLGEEKPHRSIYVDGKLYVMGVDSPNLTVLDVVTNTIKQTIKISQVPVFATTANRKLYLQHTDNRSVSVFDALTNKVTKSIYTQLGPIFGIIDSGNLFVLNQISNSMTVIDLSIDAPESHSKIDDEDGYPESLFLYGSRIFIMSTKNAKVTIFNKFNNVVTKTIPVPITPIKALRVDNMVYVLHRDTPVISVIDGSKEKLIDTIPLNHLANDFVLANNHLYVLHQDADSVSVIDTKSIALKKTVGSVISVGKGPISATVLDKYIYINNHLGNSVSVIDTTTNSVVTTIPVQPGPVSSTVVGNRLYIHSPESKSISVFYTSKPLLQGITSQTPNGAYGPGSTIDIKAVFDQPLKPGSTMTVALNSGSQVTLSQIDKGMLSGTYTVEENKTVADLTVTSIISAKIYGISDSEGTSYALLPGKNIGDYRNISLKKEKDTTAPVCQNRGLYKKCPLVKSMNIMDHGGVLLCEGIISEAQMARNHKRINRADILSIAVNMLRVPTTETNSYTGEFEDITDAMKPMVQIALDKGLLVNTRLFEPNKPVTRVEAYTLLMKSVCLVPTPTAGQNWTQAVHNTAYKAGITNKPLSRFKPSSTVTKKEVFIIAAQLADWADTTGGCQPQSCSAK